jgi:hypothetical protein
MEAIQEGARAVTASAPSSAQAGEQPNPPKLSVTSVPEFHQIKKYLT